MRLLGYAVVALSAPLAAQTDWSMVQTQTSPPGGMDFAPMVYDSARGRVVLFHQGTWEYDGSDWTLVTTSGPSPWSNAAMAYDSARQKTVLFGGVAIGGGFSGETWEWDGTDWTLRNPPNRPPLFSSYTPFRILYSAMAYHPLRQSLIVYGGLEVYRTGSVTQSINTTWEWDGTTWTQLPIWGPAIARHGMAYDDYRQRMVAGVVPYEWDGMGAWVARNTSTLPSGTNDLAFDARRQVCVYVDRSGQTWEYATTAPASYRTFGAGCPGAQGAPVLAPAAGSYPWAGSVTSLEVGTLPAAPATVLLATGFSNQQFGPLVLPVGLGFLGLPACTLYIAPEVLVALPVVQGTGLFFLTIPNAPSLSRLSFFNQAAVFDPTAPGGLTFSNATEGIVGLR